MELLFEETSYIYNIKWHRPVLYDKFIKEGSEHDYDSYFYMIIGRYGKSYPKLFYIGKTYRQVVSVRLTQKDHVARYKFLCKEYPRHKLYVVCSEIIMEDTQIRSRRVDEVETLLIYSNDCETLINKSKLIYITNKDQYMIRNSGHYKPLHKNLFYGVTSF